MRAREARTLRQTMSIMYQTSSSVLTPHHEHKAISNLAPKYGPRFKPVAFVTLCDAGSTRGCMSKSECESTTSELARDTTHADAQAALFGFQLELFQIIGPGSLRSAIRYMFAKESRLFSR